MNCRISSDSLIIQSPSYPITLKLPRLWLISCTRPKKENGINTWICACKVVKHGDKRFATVCFSKGYASGIRG